MRLGGCSSPLADEGHDAGAGEEAAEAQGLLPGLRRHVTVGEGWDDQIHQAVVDQDACAHGGIDFEACMYTCIRFTLNDGGNIANRFWDNFCNASDGVLLHNRERGPDAIRTPIL